MAGEKMYAWESGMLHSVGMVLFELDGGRVN